MPAAGATGAATRNARWRKAEAFQTQFPRSKNATNLAAWWHFFSPCGASDGLSYLVPPLAGVPAGVTPAFALEASDSGVAVELVPVLPPVVLEVDDELVALLSDAGVDGMDGVEEVEGVDEVDGVAPVSSTFLPQAPSASKAASATAVAAAGLNLDTCMSVSFYINEESIDQLDELG